MTQNTFAALLLVALSGSLGAQALAQVPLAAPAAPAAAMPPFATTKVEGTDNVYVFRYQATRRCSW